MRWRDYLKKILWWIINPFFPIGRNISKFLGYKPYPKRQEYHLGWLAPGRTMGGFNQYLLNQGFEKNRIAWIDDEELISLRLRENFRYQYHVRLFADGEIRGHYELTPEYSPLDHLHDKDTSERKEEFKKILGEWMVEEKPNEK